MIIYRAVVLNDEFGLNYFQDYFILNDIASLWSFRN